MTYAEALRRLERAFSRDLPGAEAQALLAPRPRREWPAGFNPARIRNAAALLLVYPAQAAAGRATPEAVPPRRGDDAHILLTVRAETLRHGGQVSLPGGVVDPGETFEQTALREAREEIGLMPDNVRVLGPLTPLDIPVSGFRLHPIVATTPSAPALAPHDAEVAAILDVGIEALADPSALVERTRDRDGVALAVPAFELDGRDIWGATAMVLAEFLTMLGWAPRKPL